MRPPPSAAAAAAAVMPQQSLTTAADSHTPAGDASAATTRDGLRCPCCPGIKLQPPTPKHALMGFAYCALLGSIIALVATGHFHALALSIGEFGAWGHVLFAALVVFTGQPFAWGFSMVIQTAAFTYGWWSLPTMEAGAIVGAVLGFLSTHWCLRGWVVRKVAELPEKQRELIEAAEQGASRGPRAVLFFASVRLTPLLTFGWANAFAGALTDMGWGVFMSMTVIGIQVDLVLNTYIGTVVREVSDAATPGDEEAAGSWAVAAAAEGVSSAGGSKNSSRNNNSTAEGLAGSASAQLSADATGAESATTIALVFQVVFAVLLLIGTTLWSRALLRKILREHEHAKVKLAQARETNIELRPNTSPRVGVTTTGPVAAVA